MSFAFWETQEYNEYILHAINRRFQFRLQNQRRTEIFRSIIPDLQTELGPQDDPSAAGLYA